MPRRLRWPAALVALAVPLASVAALTIPARDERTVPGTSTPLGVVAKRVAALRGLEDRQPPPVDVVTTSQLREQAKTASRATGRSATDDRRALELLGLLPERTPPPGPERDAEGLAGLYDFTSQRLVVVSDAPPELPTEAILAHELLHALEDKAFEFDPPRPDAIDDRSLAARALLEGTATLTEQRYAARHLPASKGQLTRRYAARSRDPHAYLTNQTLFPYIAGPAFVQDLLDKAGDWRLVDRAMRSRAPQTTEQVLHPDKYLSREPAMPLTLPVPPKPWRQLTSGDLGEFATAQLLTATPTADRLDAATSARAASGWGNARYALWRRAGSDRRGDTLIARWIWDTSRDADEFAAAINTITPGIWGARHIAAAVSTHDNATVTLVLDADERRAARLLESLTS